MSEIFGQYEVDFTELRGGITAKVGAIASLSGELRAGKLSEVETDAAEAEALLRRMELEARSVGGTLKTALVTKVKGYRAELAKLKAEARASSTGGSRGDAARAELGLDGTGAGGYASSSASQRERLLQTTDRLNNTSDRIRQGRQSLMQTEELGVSILQDLHRQRETITHARDTLHTADDNIGRARKVLGNMSRRMTTNKIFMGLIAIILLVCIIVVLWCKVFSHC